MDKAIFRAHPLIISAAGIFTHWLVAAEAETIVCFQRRMVKIG